MAATIAVYSILGAFVYDCAQVPQSGRWVAPSDLLAGDKNARQVVDIDIQRTLDAQEAQKNGRALLQTKTAAQVQAEIAALNALLSKYPCENGCNGHGKCKTLAHLVKGARVEPIREPTIHGRSLVCLAHAAAC